MELLKVRVLRGPNYWSNYRKKLIEVQLDLKEFENSPTNQLPHFNHKLTELLPSLFAHHCSLKQPGGFLQRLKEGTWLGHVMEHVALEMEVLAGMECGFGRTRSASKPGVYYVVFSYEVEEAGIYAAQAAFNLVKTLANQGDYYDLKKDLEALRTMWERQKLGPSTESLVQELTKRKIPFSRLDENALILIGQGKYQKMLLATETSNTSIVGVEISSDKVLTKKILSSNYIHVPPGVTIRDISELASALTKIPFPLVIKPKDANHGRGVTTRIDTVQACASAFHLAKEFSDEVIVERFIEGNDYRILVVNHNVVAAAKREPAKIVGDGESTIEMLIDRINQEEYRGKGHDNFLTEIEIDQTTLEILRSKNLSLNSIIPNKDTLYLKHTANISSGGTAEDVTDRVHPAILAMCKRISRLLHLDICGIDLITEDITKPLVDTGGAVIEVNTGPGFRMHLHPSKGKKRNVAAAVIDMLYPPYAPYQIPIIAVTGSNGKTSVVRLLASVVKSMGYFVGFTTTEGVYIGSHQIYRGDCSGPKSAKVVLQDPTVDFAILECARGGILRNGLGYDECDISILTNISGDHLGIEGIESLDQLRRLKAVVPRSTKKSGYAILNADDDLSYDIKEDVESNVALFATQKTERITQHVSKNGIVAYLENDEIFVEEREQKTYFGHIADYPFTFAGKCSANVKNILPVILASYLCKFYTTNIISALKNIEVNAQTFPGRMNVIQFAHGSILLDYAHNPAAFAEIKNYIITLPAEHKIGIIAATGDRREEDIITIGKHSAEMFDEIIIRHDNDSRGRTNDELTHLLLEGITSSSQQPVVQVISSEFTALSYAIKKSKPNSFIFYSPDDVQEAIKYLHELIQLQPNIGSEACNLEENC